MRPVLRLGSIIIILTAGIISFPTASGSVALEEHINERVEAVEDAVEATLANVTATSRQAKGVVADTAKTIGKQANDNATSATENATLLATEAAWLAYDQVMYSYESLFQGPFRGRGVDAVDRQVGKAVDPRRDKVGEPGINDMVEAAVVPLRDNETANENVTGGRLRPRASAGEAADYPTTTSDDAGAIPAGRIDAAQPEDYPPAPTVENIVPPKAHSSSFDAVINGKSDVNPLPWLAAVAILLVGAWQLIPAVSRVGVTIGAHVARVARLATSSLSAGVCALYSRMREAQTLEHPNRALLITAIISNPGVTITALESRIGLNRSTLRHHLKILLREKQVALLGDGRTSHLYPRGIGQEKSLAHARLNHPRRAMIARIVLDAPGKCQREICTQVQMPASRVHTYTNDLATANLIRLERSGRVCRYYPTDLLRSLQVCRTAGIDAQ